MRTHLEFKSSYFDIVPGEDEETNPEIYGLRLAEFLTKQLIDSGYDAHAIAEDWGRCIILQHPDFESFVGCSSLAENEWVVHITPHKPVVRRWFKKYDTTTWVEKLADIIETALIGHAGVTDFRWLSDEESGRK